MISPKHTLFIFLMMPTFAQASPSSFCGFQLGAQVGWTQRTDKTNFPYVYWNPDLQDSAIDGKKKSDGTTYGIYVGYGQNCNGFYWGGEFTIGTDNASKWGSHKIHETMWGLPADERTDVKLKTKYDRGIVFGISPRIGVVLAKENLVYVKLGVEVSRDKVLTSHEWIDLLDLDEPPEIRKKTTSSVQFVFVPGIGYERAFGKLLARVEYNYNMGGKIKTTNLLYSRGRSEFVHSPATVKYSAHILKFGMAYKF